MFNSLPPGMSLLQAYLRQISFWGKPASPWTLIRRERSEGLDAPLMLIGHGSSRHAGAGDILRGHAEALRRRGHDVRAAFLNGLPGIAEALAGHAGPWRCAVPFFMEDGYFSRVAIPRALDSADIPIARPIGVHPALPALIRQRALSACRALALAPDAVAVVLVGHGSANAPGRPLALHRHAGAVAGSGVFGSVRSACLEEPPFVAEVLAESRPGPVLVIGYFANRGGHVLDDVPALIDAERAWRAGDNMEGRVHACGNITEDPAIADIILDQAGLAQGG